MTSTAHHSSPPHDPAAQDDALGDGADSQPSPSSSGDKDSGKAIAIHFLVAPPPVSPWRSPWLKRRWKGLILGLVGLATLAIVLVNHAITDLPEQTVLHPISAAFTQVLPLSRKMQRFATYRSLMAHPATLPSNAATAVPDSTDAPLVRFGHHLYPEADPTQLMVVGSYSQDLEQRFERLHPDAGLALLRMLDVARLQGVWIVPVSGFRDIGRQDMLFHLQTQRQGSAADAAKSVAPPGFSEHHTGYAIDLADGLARARDISLRFGDTDAFRWLTRYAHEFGFELSFPPDNPQGVDYEPWHWRYVGSPEAREIFAQAH